MKGFTVKVKLVILRPLCYLVAELPALCTLRSLAVSNRKSLVSTQGLNPSRMGDETGAVAATVG